MSTTGQAANQTVLLDGGPAAADSGKSLWILEVTQDAPPTPLVTSVQDTQGHGFATISPDNERQPQVFLPPPAGKSNLTLGEACDPLNDCCETGAVCDTPDSGMTYVCLSDIQ